MRKNGSRLISLKQYKTTDLFLFALILAASETINYFIINKWFQGSVTYIFSLILPIALTVMMRWGWEGILYAMVGGALFCAFNGASWQSYLIYIIGYALIGVMLFATKFFGKERIRSKWYFSVLFVVLGWIAACIGKILVRCCLGNVNFWGLLDFFTTDLFNLVAGVVVVLVLRKLDGMFEDQKAFLKRLDKERKDKMRRDEFGDEPVEIDEEALNILNKDNDLY